MAENGANGKNRGRPLLDDVGVIGLTPDVWEETWQPRHQFLHRLAKYFWVVWVNPAIEWRKILRQGGVGGKSPSPDQPGFFVYGPKAWLPKVYRPAALARLSFETQLRQARRILERQGARKFIGYVWRPEFAGALDVRWMDATAYHIDDEYSFLDEAVPLTEQERQLLLRSNQVFIHSPGLLERKGKINPHTDWVPLGVDFQYFSREWPEPEDLARIPHPRVGYLGWLKRQLDWPLLLELARRHPEWSLVIVGPQKKSDGDTAEGVRKLSELPNVHVLGRKATADVPKYVSHMDVCLLPYRLTNYTHAIYPLKVHEYLATGHPTVGSRIRSLLQFSDVIELPATVEEWSAAIQRSLLPAAHTPERRAARQEVARKHDWSALVQKVAFRLAERLGPAYATRLEEATRGNESLAETTDDPRLAKNRP